MKTNRWFLIMAAIFVAGSVFAQSEVFDDDIYASSKSKKSTVAVKKEVAAEPEQKTVSQVETLVVEDRDVDEYNRRYASNNAYSDATTEEAVNDTVYEYVDGELSERIVKFHNPDKIVITGAGENVNIRYTDEGYELTFSDEADSDISSDYYSPLYFDAGWGGWFSPYSYYSGWYSPWRYGWYSPWYSWAYYDPWYSWGYYNPWFYRGHFGYCYGWYGYGLHGGHWGHYGYNQYYANGHRSNGRLNHYSGAAGGQGRYASNSRSASHNGLSASSRTAGSRISRDNITSVRNANSNRSSLARTNGSATDRSSTTAVSRSRNNSGNVATRSDATQSAPRTRVAPTQNSSSSSSTPSYSSSRSYSGGSSSSSGSSRSYSSSSGSTYSGSTSSSGGGSRSYSSGSSGGGSSYSGGGGSSRSSGGGGGGRR
jgi:hypothetical protein